METINEIRIAIQMSRSEKTSPILFQGISKSNEPTGNTISSNPMIARPYKIELVMRSVFMFKVQTKAIRNL